MSGIDQDFAARVRALLGPSGVLDAAEDMAPYLLDWRKRYRGNARLVARPGSTDEVAALVRLCAEARVPIVPQGGNTGLCGGATPDDTGDALLLSLTRMNRARAVDPANNTITVEAGMTLAAVQEAADAADRLFPLSLAAEGTATIGGNLSTNAGGVAVLRYGNARDLVLGLEVVLADGRVWDGLRGLRKDNTGYDLKHLFIGAEGTLGIITAAVLKLFPKPRGLATAFAAVPGPEAAVALLDLARGASGDAVTAFELVPRFALDLVLRHIPNTADPLAAKSPWYVLVELSAGGEGAPRIAEDAERLLATALDAGLVTDAVLAASEAQRVSLWRLRESISEAQAIEGASVKHDVAVPVSAIPAFVAEGAAAVTRLAPDARLCAFGHVGDGNLHFNVSQPESVDGAGFLAGSGALTRAIHDIVAAHRGSISAEHGLGQLKAAEVDRYKAPLERELQARLKAALDPAGLLNPGKIFPGR
jgi:FAD/FMN-containing dehydrogenase